MAVPLNLVVGAALVLVTSGCVVPKKLPEKNPFGNDVVGFIEPGVSTRQGVEETLGIPFYTFSDGRWWAYCANRQETEWLWFMLAPDNVGGGTFGGDTRQYSLVLEFDDDVIDDVVVITAEDGCVRNGAICHQCGYLEILEEGKRTKMTGQLGANSG